MKHGSTFSPNTVYSQYERRLFIMPIIRTTTRRPIQQGEEPPASHREAESSAPMEFGEGDDRVSFPLPPANVITPTITIKKEENDEDRDVQMSGTDFPYSPKVDSLVDERVEEEDAKDVTKIMPGISRHSAEHKVVNALHRSDEEDGGMLQTQSSGVGAIC